MVVNCGARGKNGRWRRDQKGKSVLTKEKKPKNWIPSLAVIQFQTILGGGTRAKAVALIEYN